MSNAKQTALAVILYLGDHNDKFSFAADDLSAIVLPYVKHKEILLSKGTGKPFTFNKRLTGTKMIDIAEPNKTVMLYEGTNERFTFTDGKTVVAFTDGHVRLLTPATVKTAGLRWKP
jgi:prepilin-type processing-associated H-X9-DG protein